LNERGEMKKVIMAAVAILGIGTVAFFVTQGSDEVSAKGSSIVVENPVVRSIDSASYKNEETGKYMTGSFMTITNNGEEDVTLTGGSSPIAGIVEIHEVIDGVMLPMADGLVIPAGESVKLRMGGYHVMLLELTEEVKAGDETEVTLRFSDGSEQTITAPVKDIAMDDEVYGADGGM
jgi:copper(I)-binding protein